MAKNSNRQTDFVDWFRNSSPYIHAHRGRTFVIAFDGEAVASDNFACLVHDIALLQSLGIRLVLVHGSRPQIDSRLRSRKIPIKYTNGLRVTGEAALECVKEAVGAVRVEIEALFSMGRANAPTRTDYTRVASGNLVTAQPLGVRDGVDYQYTGEVRRIDVTAINAHLDRNEIVLLSPMGYSPTGEVFNLYGDAVAASTAVALGADKLLYLAEHSIVDGRRRRIGELDPPAVNKLLGGRRQWPDALRRQLESAVHACHGGVARCHLIDRHRDGALLLELFSRDGIGTLITSGDYEGLRAATIDDVGGILQLIAPLEAQGSLVRRSRERLEMEIDRFSVIERDGMVIACASLYPYPDEHLAELACLAVHEEYRNGGRASALLDAMERRARTLGIRRLFVLTTRSAHWFRERGFRAGDLDKLPLRRRSLYNYQRNSRIFLKTL